MPGRVRAGRLLAAALVALAAHAAPSVAQEPDPIRFSVSFGDEARLGNDTSMTLSVHVDRRLAPLTEFRLLTPRGIELATSNLGVEACKRPASAVAAIGNPVVQHPCPANSLMGSGSASANLLLDPEDPERGAGHVELHAGATVRDHPGLVVMVNTYNPMRMQLTYVGYLYVPPEDFGVGVAILVPPLPEPPFGAPVALSDLRLAVGRSSITYYRDVHGRRVAYRPGGIPLPRTCAPAGFRFRAVLRFADGSRRAADARVPCPRPRP